MQDDISHSDDSRKDGAPPRSAWLAGLLETARPVATRETVWLPDGMGSFEPTRSTGHEQNDHHDEQDVIVQLDVSVGIEEPEALRAINLRFHGLPPRTRLTHGNEVAPGTWEVNALDLANLCVLIPPSCPDFDLVVDMDTGSGPPQSARIRMSASTATVSDESPAITLTVGPPVSGEDTRFKVYADGVPVYDRVVGWRRTGNGHQSLSIPITWGADKPFELLVRCHPNVSGQSEGDGPVLYGIETPEQTIAVTSGAVSGRITRQEEGITWRGDLTIGLSLSATEEITVTGTDATDVSTGLVSAQPIIEVNEAETEFSDSIPSEQDLESSAPPEDDAFDDTSANTTNESLDEDAILELHVDIADLKQHAFIEELRRLKDYVLTHGAGDHESLYDRLSINVSKWRNMRVIGPSGADVELDEPFPNVFPLGGRDGGRPLHQMVRDTTTLREDNQIRISGLPPGTMLTHGQNMGNGIWLIDADFLAHVAVLPPIGNHRSIRALIEPIEFERDPDIQVSLIGGPLSNIEPIEGPMREFSFNVPRQVFDPEQLGTLTLTIGDMPRGVLLSQGSNHGDGVWSLNCQPGQTLKIAIPIRQGMFDISVTAVASGKENEESTVVTRRIKVDPPLDFVEIQEASAG